VSTIRDLLVICIAFIVLAQVGSAQRRVDAGVSYERLYAVVGIVGSGSLDDPKRPKYAPAPNAQSSQSRTGILGYQFVKGDDGMALVQYVAASQAAFKEILADPTIKTFLRGRDSQAAMEAEFLKHIKTFDFAHFGVRMQ
jgi:hypothetical protein